MGIEKKCIVFFLFFLLIPYSKSQNQTIMNSSIALMPNILLSSSPDKSSYCPPENITIITSIENVGNVATFGDLREVVINPYSNVFMNESWNNIPVSPGEKLFFYLNHTVSEEDVSGIYEVRTNFSYDNKWKYVSKNFRIKQGIGDLIASPPFIEETAMPGDTIVNDIYFWLIYACHGTSVFLNTTQGPPGSWIYFSLNPVYLSPTEWNVTRVFIYIDLPETTEPGDYSGYIYGWAEGQRLVIPVKIHVLTSAIFDLKVEVPSEKKEVCQGSDAYAKVKIIKNFPPGLIDVSMSYRIEKNESIYDEKNETVAVDTTLEKIVKLKVPSDAEEGIYTFSARLQYNKTSVYASDIFRVKYCPPIIPSPPSVLPKITPVFAPELVLNLSTRRIHSIIGKISSFLVTVTNVGNETSKGTRIRLDGIPLGWTTITPFETDIAPGEREDYLVLIKVPHDAEEGVYLIKVVATNSENSNEEKMFLTIGRDEESLAKILFEEANISMEKAYKTLFLTCLDIKEIISKIESNEKIIGVAIKEFREKNWKKSIELFEYLLDENERIIDKVNMLMDEEFSSLKTFSFPPFTVEINERLKKLSENLRERDYSNFCENINKVKKLSFYSTILLISIVSALLFSLLSIFIIYRKRVELEPLARLRKIKERLGIK